MCDIGQLIPYTEKYPKCCNKKLCIALCRRWMRWSSGDVRKLKLNRHDFEEEALGLYVSAS